MSIMWEYGQDKDHLARDTADRENPSTQNWMLGDGPYYAGQIREYLWE
jgi:hypothetical protein